MALWRTSQILEVKFATNETIDWIDINKETRTLYHREDKRTWVNLWAPQLATNLRESFRWNITQDNSNEEIDGLEELMLEEIDGFNYLLLDNLRIMKHDGKLSRMA